MLYVVKHAVIKISDCISWRGIFGRGFHTKVFAGASCKEKKATDGRKICLYTSSASGNILTRSAAVEVVLSSSYSPHSPKMKTGHVKQTLFWQISSILKNNLPTAMTRRLNLKT